MNPGFWAPLDGTRARKAMNTARFGTMRVKSAEFGDFALLKRRGGQESDLGSESHRSRIHSTRDLAILRISGPSISWINLEKQVLR